jgi:hypothetical protein
MVLRDPTLGYGEGNGVQFVRLLVGLGCYSGGSSLVWGLAAGGRRSRRESLNLTLTLVACVGCLSLRLDALKFESDVHQYSMISRV